MDRHDRIEEQLAQVPLFEGLSKKELRLVAQLSTVPEICQKLIPVMAARLADLDEQEDGSPPLLRADEPANPR
jgi:hypothetical protein